MVTGEPVDILVHAVWLITSSASGAAETGLGKNSTTALTGMWAWVPASVTQFKGPFLTVTTLAEGYNYLTTVEKSDAGTASFESSSGAQGKAAFTVPM